MSRMTIKPTRKAVHAAAVDLGVTLGETDGYFREWTAEAPGNLVFAATGTHSVVAEAITMREVWQFLAEDMSMGLEECIYGPDCEGH